MQVLVISDSHGNTSNIKKVLSDNPQADTVIFLGDCVRDLQSIKPMYGNIDFYCVSGNCDVPALANYYDILSLCGSTILITHGHTFSVKSGTQRLIEYAKNINADIVLYGHTHISDVCYKGGVIAINPGSVARSRNGRNSYCLMELERGKPPKFSINTL